MGGLRLSAALVLLLASALANGAYGQEAPDEDVEAKARGLYEQAALDYRLGRFSEALEGFQSALAIVNRPSIIFNVAQCHRLLKNNEKALFFYRQYLTEWERQRPGEDPPNKAEVQEYIAILDAQVTAAKLAKGEPGDREIDLEPAPTTPPTVATTPPPEEEATSVTETWWFWTLVGVGVAGVAAVTVVASQPEDAVTGSLAPGQVQLK